MDSELSATAVNSARQKRFEDVMDMGQGDDRLPGTSRTMTDVTIVPPMLMARLKLASYKTKRSDRTLTGATLEMEILSRCGENALWDFRPLCMNHGKGSVIGELTPVEYNRLTLSDTGGYIEMIDYRNSARGYLIVVEKYAAMEYYLEEMIQGTTMKQKAYRTLASSKMHAETVDKLVSLPWRALVVLHFEEEMRATPKIHTLIAIPYVRTEQQLLFSWCMAGFTMEEYDSEERKKSKEEKVLMMTSLRYLLIREVASVACAKWRDALYFVRFMLE